MAVIIYNPKTFGGKPSQPVKFLWDNNNYKLAVNSLAKFPDEVGKEMLKRYGFLEEVKPEGIERIKKQMVAKAFVCEYCKAEFYSEKELTGHKLGKHKLSKENEALLKDIPDAIMEAVGEKKPLNLEPEIPESGATDKAGVEWYGEGVEDDGPEKGKK